MTESVCFGTSADDQNVARVLAALKTAIHQGSVDEAAKTQTDCDQDERQENYPPGNVLGPNEVERSGEEEAGSKADLDGEALLVEERANVFGRIEMKAAAGYDKRNGETANKAQQDPHRAPIEECSVVKGACTHDRSGVAFIDCGDDRGHQNGEEIKKDPEFDFALGTARRVAPCLRLPLRRGRDRC